jgi:hypothetical protein
VAGSGKRRLASCWGLRQRLHLARRKARSAGGGDQHRPGEGEAGDQVECLRRSGYGDIRRQDHAPELDPVRACLPRCHFVVTRRYSSGLLNFAAHSLDDTQRDRKCRSARLERTVPKGLFRYRTAGLRAFSCRCL